MFIFSSFFVCVLSWVWVCLFGFVFFRNWVLLPYECTLTSCVFANEEVRLVHKVFFSCCLFRLLIKKMDHHLTISEFPYCAQCRFSFGFWLSVVFDEYWDEFISWNRVSCYGSEIRVCVNEKGYVSVGVSVRLLLFLEWEL